MLGLLSRGGATAAEREVPSGPQWAARASEEGRRSLPKGLGPGGAPMCSDVHWERSMGTAGWGQGPGHLFADLSMSPPSTWSQDADAPLGTMPTRKGQKARLGRLGPFRPGTFCLHLTSQRHLTCHSCPWGWPGRRKALGCRPMPQPAVSWHICFPVFCCIVLLRPQSGFTSLPAGLKVLIGLLW